MARRMRQNPPQPSPSPTVPPVGQQAAPSYTDVQGQFAGAMPSGTVADDWSAQKVFLGFGGMQEQAQVQAPGMPPGFMVRPPAKPEEQWTTAGELAAMWYSMSELDRTHYKDTFILMGLVNPQRATDMDYSNIWTSYAQQLASYNKPQANWGTKLTIDDLIATDLKKKEQAEEKAAQQPKTVTRTSTSTQLSTQQDAASLMDAAAKALLGRAATEDEAKKLLAAVNELEKANAQKTTVTQQLDAEGSVVSQTEETTGGVGAGAREQIAKEQTLQNPEYGAYQAATTYMGSLMDLVYGQGY